MADGQEVRKPYIVIHPVDFRRKLYTLRSVLRLTEAEAAGWLKSGYIKPLPALLEDPK